MSCPNINLLKSYKVFPRVHNFNYLKDLFFIYVYLDPFKELKKPMEVEVLHDKFCFAYMPFYIGKGTGAGYRQNQHIQTFNKGNEHNIYKKQAFEQLLSNMAKAAALKQIDKPWNWQEFQRDYIIVLKTFETPIDLIKFEIAIINKIGTIWDKTGPLTNKIKNATKFDFVLTTGKRAVF